MSTAELQLLTVKQVSELLQVKPEWLYDKTKSGDFPHVRLGRHIRFRPVDIEAYLRGEWES